MKYRTEMLQLQQDTLTPTPTPPWHRRKIQLHYTKMAYILYMLRYYTDTTQPQEAKTQLHYS